MDSSEQITLDEVIYSAMNILEEDETKYFKYFQISLEVLRDFKMHHMKGINHAELEMDSRNRLSLPSDCIRIVTIGLPYLGRVWTFTIDDELLRNTTIKGGIEIRDATKGEIDVVNDDITGYDTAGGVNDWYYTIDYNARTIIISGKTISEPVTIHYISSGISLDSVTYVPASALLALRSAIIFYANVYKTDVIGDQKTRNEKLYKEEIAKYQHFNMPSLTQIRDIYLSTVKQSVKR